MCDKGWFWSRTGAAKRGTAMEAQRWLPHTLHPQPPTPCTLKPPHPPPLNPRTLHPQTPHPTPSNTLHPQPPIREQGGSARTSTRMAAVRAFALPPSAHSDISSPPEPPP